MGENLSSGFPTRLKLVSLAAETSKKIENSFVASLDKKISNKQITKGRIYRMSAPLLFASLQVFLHEGLSVCLSGSLAHSNSQLTLESSLLLFHILIIEIKLN